MEKKTIQFTSGRGPRECEWVVAKTFAFFLKKAAQQGIEAEVLDKQNAKSGHEFLSVTIVLTGKKVQAFIQPWLGTIQWVGQSPFRQDHKRKNWFIGVFEVSDQNFISFDEKEVTYQTMRSSGAGGQHVNKVSSAVRAIHKPTGIMTLSMDSRSQLQNKKVALTRLKEKFEDLNRGKMNDARIDKWSNHLELQRGNPVKVFYGDRFKIKS